MTSRSARAQPSATPGVRVMVVDDHPGFRRAARAVIDATVGFESVGDAASGPEALARAHEAQPDLVLVDVLMPEMGGVETARRLNASHPETVVVLVSLDELDEASAVLASCRAVAFLVKQDFGTKMLRSLWATHGAAPRTDT